MTAGQIAIPSGVGYIPSMRKIWIQAMILASLVWVGPVTSAKGGGDGANNGGGIAEQNFAYAYLNLGRFAETCLEYRDICPLGHKESMILIDIWQKSHEEVQANPTLFFESEQEKPGFFFLDGNVRIAKTGDRLGTKVFINRDLIYFKNSRGEVAPLDIPSAVGVLIHEFGHHAYQLPEMTHEELDVLGAKVKAAAEVWTESLVFGTGNPYLLGFDMRPVIHFIRYGADLTATDLLITDSYEIHSLGKRVLSELRCAKVGDKPLRFNASNLHWTRWGSLPTGGEFSLTVRGAVIVWCGDPQAEVPVYHPEMEQWLEIGMRFVFDPQTRLDEGSLVIRQVPRE